MFFTRLKRPEWLGVDLTNIFQIILVEVNYHYNVSILMAIIIMERRKCEGRWYK